MTAWGNGVLILPGTIKQGYLTKSPPLEKAKNIVAMWRRRWCILTVTGGELFLAYYQDESSSYQTTPIARVSLNSCNRVESNLHHKDRENVFAIHLPERVYYFSAPSRYEMVEWVDAICTHLNLNSSDACSTTSPDSPRFSLSSVSNVYTTSLDVKQSSTFPRSPSPLLRNTSSPLPYSTERNTLPRASSPRPRGVSSPLPPPPGLLDLPSSEIPSHVDSQLHPLPPTMDAPTGRRQNSPLPPVPPPFRDSQSLQSAVIPLPCPMERNTLPRPPSPRQRGMSTPLPPPPELLDLPSSEIPSHLDSQLHPLPSLSPTMDAPTGRRKNSPLPPVPPPFRDSQDGPPPPLPPRPDVLRHSTASGNIYVHS